MRLRKSLLLLAILSVALAGCGSREGSVQGTVTQAKDPAAALNDPANVGQPVAEARIVVYGLERVKEVTKQEVYRKGLIVYKGYSDDSGAFSFALAPGHYLLEVWVNGLGVGDRQIEVKSGKTTTVAMNVKLPG